jgi:hypothetical protein
MCWIVLELEEREKIEIENKPKPHTNPVQNPTTGPSPLSLSHRPFSLPGPVRQPGRPIPLFLSPAAQLAPIPTPASQPAQRPAQPANALPSPLTSLARLPASQRPHRVALSLPAAIPAPRARAILFLQIPLAQLPLEHLVGDHAAPPHGTPPQDPRPAFKLAPQPLRPPSRSAAPP